MTDMQRQQVEELSKTGWTVAREKKDRVEMVHIAGPHGAFSVTCIHIYGGYSWVGSYPLSRLASMYPSFRRRARV